MSGSGISWTICKSAPCSRQLTTPAHHQLSFLQAGCASWRPTNRVKALKALGGFFLVEQIEIHKKFWDVEFCGSECGIFCYPNCIQHCSFPNNALPKFLGKSVHKVFEYFRCWCREWHNGGELNQCQILPKVEVKAKFHSSILLHFRLKAYYVMLYYGFSTSPKLMFPWLPFVCQKHVT